MAGHFLAGIELPRGMLWVDEFNWSAVQKTVERSITGAQIIDAAARIEGRPITLQAAEDQGWIRRATLLAVQALADVPGAQYPLRWLTAANTPCSLRQTTRLPPRPSPGPSCQLKPIPMSPRCG
jgi:hypothetical protein